MARAKSEGIPAPVAADVDLTVPVLVAPGTPPPTVPKVRHYTTAQDYADAEAYRQTKLVEHLVERAIKPLVDRLDKIDDFRSKVALLFCGALITLLAQAAKGAL